MLTRLVRCVVRSRTKTSEEVFVSPATRFVADDSNATYRPEPLSDGAELGPLDCVDPVAVLMRLVVVMHGDGLHNARTKMSATALVSPLDQVRRLGPERDDVAVVADRRLHARPVGLREREVDADAAGRTGRHAAPEDVLDRVRVVRDEIAGLRRGTRPGRRSALMTGEVLEPFAGAAPESSDRSSVELVRRSRR